MITDREEGKVDNKWYGVTGCNDSSRCCRSTKRIFLTQKYTLKPSIRNRVFQNEFVTRDFILPRYYTFGRPPIVLIFIATSNRVVVVHFAYFLLVPPDIVYKHHGPSS
jgi:hypothetical protein